MSYSTKVKIHLATFEHMYKTLEKLNLKCRSKKQLPHMKQMQKFQMTPFMKSLDIQGKKLKHSVSLR